MRTRIYHSDAPTRSPLGVADLDSADAGGREGPRRLLAPQSLRGQSVELVAPNTPPIPPGFRQPATTEGNLLRLLGTDENATAVTLQLFGPELLEPLNAPSNSRVRGNLFWGTDAGRAQAEIDWIVGTTVTLWASSLNLSATHEGVAPSRVRVYAHVGYQPYGDAVPAQRTRYMDVPLVAAGVFPVIVPAFAHSLRLTLLPATAQASLLFLAAGGAPLYEVAYAGPQTAPIAASQVPIANDVRTVVLTNTGAVAVIASARFTFALRL